MYYHNIPYWEAKLRRWRNLNYNALISKNRLKRFFAKIVDSLLVKMLNYYYPVPKNSKEANQ